jgi:3-deoxy-D-manno-octulosonate 8-phosphate phosphatase (KDO 8-P phosphatase)
MQNILQYFTTIKAFVFDVDGVLTDGSLIILPNNVMARTMNVKDGYALQLAIKKGFKVAIISGGNSVEVVERLALLGVEDVYMKVLNKVAALENFINKYQLNKNEVLFMGDDIPDVDVMLEVALPCCPADAVDEIKTISKYISPFNGGKGCARDVIEKTMKLVNCWEHNQSVSSK